MRQVYTNIRFLYNLNVPMMLNYNDIASKIGITPSLLNYLLSSETKLYKEITIKKRNGSNRIVYKPCYSLKMVQRWILINILYKINPSNNCYAFIKSKGSLLKKNAEAHQGCKFLLKFDLKDFFNTLTYYDVYKIFVMIGYSIEVSTILTKLCTFNGFLPQGAVTSPYLSNLIVFRLDRRLNGLCVGKEIVYTRYADDMMFSCENSKNLKSIYKSVTNIIKDENLIINEEKIHFITSSGRMQVLGITINDNHLKVSKKYKRQIRSSIFNMIRYGDYDSKNMIKGKISHVNSIEEGYSKKVRKYILTLYKKNIWNEDLIKLFNDNKLFEDLPNQSLRTIDENDLIHI